jgi:RNA polymerase sigma factor (sigma-70 family)
MTRTEGLGPSFEVTIAQAIEGDGAAFEAIYRGYARRVRAFADARGSDDAEAVANDVMLRVFQNLANFRGDEPAFVRWLFTIARNRLIDGHRASSRRPVRSDREVPDRVEESAELVALGQMSGQDALARLAILTTDQREVIALRLIDDLSLADVAEIVGRPVTAVKALQRRGLRRLQRHILAEGVS